MEWKFTKEVNKKDIENVESILNFKFPLDFMEDIIKYNAGIPENKEFLLSTGEEKVFNNLLSFNKEAGEYIVTFNDFETSHKEKFIAIALDSFGNHIGYDKISNEIMFLDHETDILIKIANNWSELKEQLSNWKETKYLKEIEPLVEKEMLENGFWKKDENGKITVFDGSCHTAWAITKRLMKEKFDYNWMSPQDRNPNINFS